MEAHGRTPRKSDKEIMRPLYQRYHEVKAELDALQSSLEAAHGPLSLSLNASAGMISYIYTTTPLFLFSPLTSTITLLTTMDLCRCR